MQFSLVGFGIKPISLAVFKLLLNVIVLFCLRWIFHFVIFSFLLLLRSDEREEKKTTNVNVDVMIRSSHNALSAHENETKNSYSGSHISYHTSSDCKQRVKCKCLYVSSTTLTLNA